MRRHTRRLLTTTLLALAALLAGAGAAQAAIYDGDATPSSTFYLHGAAAGSDIAYDVVRTSSATRVVGVVDNGAVNGEDASLVRIPTGSSATPTVRSWNAVSNDSDINYHVAARGTYAYTAGRSRNAAGNDDLILIRWSGTTGALKWVKRYAGLARQDDIATDVVVDPAGNAIVCGTTENALGFTSWVVLKYSPSGTKLWTWKYDPSAIHMDQPAEMYVDGKGNIYLTGFSWQTTVTGAYTVKLSPAGKVLWSRKYRGPEGRATAAAAIARCPSGGIYIGGYTTTAAGGTDAFLRRYAADGTGTRYDLWDGGTVGATIQTLNDIAVASNTGGGVLLAGASDGWALMLRYGREPVAP